MMPRNPVLIGISLPPRWIAPLERATERLRQAYPGADDAEIMERLLHCGIVALLANDDTEAAA